MAAKIQVRCALAPGSRHRADELTMSAEQLIGKSHQSQVRNGTETKLENLRDTIRFCSRSAPHAQADQRRGRRSTHPAAAMAQDNAIGAARGLCKVHNGCGVP